MKVYFFLIVLLIGPSNILAQKETDEAISYKDDLTVDWKKSNDTLRLTAKSKSIAPIQLYFHSRADSTELRSFLLMPQDSITLVESSEVKIDSVFKKKFRDSVRVSYYFGHKSLVRPDFDYPYRLPFRKGRKYEVSQSFGGKASHFSEISKYAIDFQLNVGDLVYAARGGVVMKVIDWFKKQGGEELKYAANKIVILHNDGTMASYVHLDYRGSFVKEGQRVKEGDKIGISGLTGYTNGPHLHFVVRKENDIAIPIYFKGYMGKTLKQGKRYKVK